MGQNEELSDKDLTLKTVMLLALTAIIRCSDLHILDSTYMAIGTDKIVFNLPGRPKNCRKRGQKPEPVVFRTSGSNLCPVGTIKAYIERTKSWREKNNESKFFW